MNKSLSFAALAAASFFAVFSAHAQSGFEDHLIAQQDYVWHTIVFTQANKIKLETTAPSLRPAPDDIKVYLSDLNGDSKDDFVASVNNFLYKKDGAYAIYVMLADKYGYTQIAAEPGIKTFDIKALDTSHNGMKDFEASGQTYIYDGKSYKAE